MATGRCCPAPKSYRSEEEEEVACWFVNPPRSPYCVDADMAEARGARRNPQDAGGCWGAFSPLLLAAAGPGAGLRGALCAVSELGVSTGGRFKTDVRGSDKDGEGLEVCKRSSSAFFFRLGGLWWWLALFFR